MRKGYPSKLRRSVVGYASAGFAEAVKMPRAEARGASLLLNKPLAEIIEDLSDTAVFAHQIGDPI
jgi:hypothetical protein